MLIVSPGWALSNAVARACTAVSDGAGLPAAAVVTSHALTVAVGALELEPLPAAVDDEVEEVELLELHAAAPVTTAAASAAAASARLLRMVVSWEVMAQGTFESFRILSTCRYRKFAPLKGQPR